MKMIKAAATTTATAMVPQNITLGRASTSAPIHSISSPADRCCCSWVSSGLSSPNGVLTAGVYKAPKGIVDGIAGLRCSHVLS